MATASEIITLAYREANFKNSIGTPTTEEFTEGLTLLQSIVDSLSGLVAGIRLDPWYVPNPQRESSVAANYPASPGDVGPHGPTTQEHPPSNVRLMMRNTEPVTVYFQYQPEDGAVMEYVDTGHEADITLSANGTLFGLSGSVEDIDIAATFPNGRNAPRRWVFRADHGSWIEILPLTQSSVMPFPSAFDDYFVTTLAIRLSPRFGADPRNVTLLRQQQMETFIRHQYLQSREALVGTAGGPTQQVYNRLSTHDHTHHGSAF